MDALVPASTLFEVRRTLSRTWLTIPGQVADMVDRASRPAKLDVAGVQRNFLAGMGEDYEAELEKLKGSVIQ